MDTTSLATPGYLAALGLLGIFGIHRLALLRRFRWYAGESTESAEELPPVTVQLPLFNERTVAAAVDPAPRAPSTTPADRLEIQVLDDSTDDTTRRSSTPRSRSLVRAKASTPAWCDRTDRTGYKAGALENGMEPREGRPRLQCSTRTSCPSRASCASSSHHFHDPKVGMVQARWGHSNRD